MLKHSQSTSYIQFNSFFIIYIYIYVHLNIYTFFTFPSRYIMYMIMRTPLDRSPWEQTREKLYMWATKHKNLRFSTFPEFAQFQ